MRAGSAGMAVLLAGAPVSSIVLGTTWVLPAAVVIAAVVMAGLLLHRAGAAAVAAGQLLAAVAVLTAVFTDDRLLGVIPTPGGVREFGALLAGAGEQINVGTAPVPATPEILFLSTTVFGLLAIAVHLAAVSAGAPAAAGVPLLAAFAVPAALADTLLPWWAMVSAAAGFGLLLLARDGERRQFSGGGAAVVAGAVVLALGIGAVGSFVGTAGRFESGAGAGGSGGSIGLSPFTALRGQLDQGTPVELLRVRGLPRATYLRALTLREYLSGSGWRASDPEPGEALPGLLAGRSADPAEIVDIEIENVSFRDYWLPLYGVPIEVSDLPEGKWVYDARSGTAYTARPREETGWRQRAALAVPTAATLRAADGLDPPSPAYLDVAGVDPLVADIADSIVAGRTTAFDQAVALQDHFTGPGTAFRYSLQTAPGAGDDALVEFLTVGRTGYCEQYASAMAVMLRTLGVPARVAVGFTGGVEVDGYRSISTSDAHAWVEAWLPGAGWTTFDPTPLAGGRGITPPYVLEARAEVAGSADPVIQDDVNLRAADQAPAADPAAPEPAAPGTAGPDEAAFSLPLWSLATVALLVLLVLGVLAPMALRSRARRVRLSTVATGGPDAATAAWEEVLAESADRGVPARPSDTVRVTARRLVHEHRLDAAAQQSMRAVVGAVESSWYAAAGTAASASAASASAASETAPAQGEHLAESVNTIRDGIASRRALSLRERLLPRSVLLRCSELGSDDRS